MDPKGKVALVTGGASGIGLACTKKLLESGANVVLCDINCKLGEEITKELEKQYGQDRIIFIKTDVTNGSEFEEAFKKTFEHFKDLDIVFNNAGVSDDAEWEFEVDINLKAVMRGSLLAHKYMGKDNGGKGGVVVNTASIFGLESSTCTPMYAGTKYGVVGFSQSLGLSYHFNRTGISVLTLCPGATSTPMHEQAFTRTFTAEWGKKLAVEKDSYPLQTPEDVSQSFLHVLKTGESGSVWVSEGNETYRINFPDRKSLRSN